MWSCARWAFALILAATAPDYPREIEAWRAQREARLRAEDGWLSVVGLSWLKEGANTMGSARGSAVMLPMSAPARVGVLELSGASVTARIDPGVVVTLDDAPVTVRELKPDTSGKPDMLALGALRVQVIERGGRFGVRVKDSESRARKEFHGLEWFPVRESYRVTARFVPYDPPKEIPIVNVLGQVSPMPSPGYVEFALGGRTIRLDPVLEEPSAKELFFMFRDATASGDTYPAGRFLYTEMPQDGRVVLDFNKAYSPPCAFTAFATCPLPPKQNRLDLRIEAGEKRPAVIH